MKKILFTLAAIAFASSSFAQDFDFSDDGAGSSFDSSSFEESTTPAITISGEVGAETRAWIGAPNKDSKKYDTRAYKGAYDLSKTELDVGAYANLELNYDGEYTGANLKLKLDSSTLKENHEDIIDELYANGSFKEGKFQLKAGKMKEVWGKGDKIHVLDNFNANDYSDFIFPDYIDRRIGEVMFKATANLSWDYNLKLEGIYTPWMTADRFANDGYLVPAAQKELTTQVESIVKAKYEAGLKDALANQKYGALIDGLQEMSGFTSDKLYEDNLRTLKYSQGGLRLTGTAAGIDWGASYYYGHYKQPSPNLNGTIIYKAAQSMPSIASLAASVNPLPSLNYDQLQVFGLEAAFVVWKLNTRWEVAYNLTEDIAGDDPWVRNNSVAWVAGFDIDLPIHNLNINFQETGTYILKNDKIKNGGLSVAGMNIPWTMLGKNYDVNANSDDKYINNKLIVLISDKYLNEKLTTELQGIYCIEDKGYMIAPKIEYNVSEGLTFALRGVYLHCDNENGEFYNFTADSEHNDKAFIELTAKYQF